ncbi:MAG: universal stress protein [Deltaproteobacteria bacterium]|nr:universal stress protein [Deltaproteobacteria bacterium]
MDPQTILLAVDDSESSIKAIDYVGRIVGHCPGFKVTIMHVIEDPPEDYFEHSRAREEFLAEKNLKTQIFLEQARDRLIEHGLNPNQVAFRSPVKSCSSMAACILEEQEEEKAGTLVVGRRGISKSEEFLFGSVSNKIIHYARHCTVWVVE